jgi:hypothetical protein
VCVFVYGAPYPHLLVAHFMAMMSGTLAVYDIFRGLGCSPVAASNRCAMLVHNMAPAEITLFGPGVSESERHFALARVTVEAIVQNSRTQMQWMIATTALKKEPTRLPLLAWAAAHAFTTNQQQSFKTLAYRIRDAATSKREVMETNGIVCSRVYEWLQLKMPALRMSQVLLHTAFGMYGFALHFSKDAMAQMYLAILRGGGSKDMEVFLEHAHRHERPETPPDAELRACAQSGNVKAFKETCTRLKVGPDDDAAVARALGDMYSGLLSYLAVEGKKAMLVHLLGPSTRAEHVYEAVYEATARDKSEMVAAIAGTTRDMGDGEWGVVEEVIDAARELQMQSTHLPPDARVRGLICLLEAGLVGTLLPQVWAHVLRERASPDVHLALLLALCRVENAVAFQAAAAASDIKNMAPQDVAACLPAVSIKSLDIWAVLCEKRGGGEFRIAAKDAVRLCVLALNCNRLSVITDMRESLGHDDKQALAKCALTLPHGSEQAVEWLRAALGDEIVKSVK